MCLRQLPSPQPLTQQRYRVTGSLCFSEASVHASQPTLAGPHSVSALAWLAVKQIGHYEILGELGRGGRCQDLWHSSYRGAPKDGSAWDGGAGVSERVRRGGGWYDKASLCRSAERDGFKQEPATATWASAPPSRSPSNAAPCPSTSP